MWEPYLKVIREKCSEALHILDRFHIVAKMNKALDEVARESRRMASEDRTPLLKKSRWLLLKREENLKAEQRFRLRDLLRYNLKSVRAYLLKEAFQQLWDYSSPSWAGKFLDEWCRQTMRSRIRAHEDRSISSPAPGTDPQLLPGAKNDFQRGRGGLEQQGQSHPEKILWLSHLPGARTLPISLAWQAA
jgi:transposase